MINNIVCSGDKTVLHSIMSQIDLYSRPFPSPDHTYAISPAKEENTEDVKCEAADTEDVKEETPTYRGRVSFIKQNILTKILLIYF